MIHTAIALQVVETKGGKMMSCYETKQDEHVPPLMTGANEIHPTCIQIQASHIQLLTPLTISTYQEIVSREI